VVYEQLPITSPFEPGPGKGILRPEDLTNPTLPVALRGYDREQVDRFLHLVSESYLLVWRQGVALRERLRSLEQELAAAQDEAETSASSVADLSRRFKAAVEENSQLVRGRGEVSAKLEVSERERRRAMASLAEVSERTAELEQQLQALGNARQPGLEGVVPASSAGADGEVAALLIAATRAAEDVRRSSRERALKTLTKARDRATQLRAEAEREQAALAQLRERREQAEREADEILLRTRTEVDRVVAAMEEERKRVRELLAGALASLTAEAATPPGENLMAHLSSRLIEHAENSGASDA
jgi:DivIVA domain-containing protein